MNDHTADTVGVDISKAHLDAHRLSTGEAARFANDADGFEELAAWVGDPAALVACESTGPWHRGLEESLAGRLRLARVHAVRARRFAQALGEDAKTDAADARVLAAMGAAVELRIVEPRPAALRDLDELVAAHGALVRDRTAALNREKQARHAVVRRQHRSRLALIGRQIEALDAEIAKATAADGELARRNEVLTSIPGIGPAVAATLLADVPELGRVDGKAAASLVGVAPRTRARLKDRLRRPVPAMRRPSASAEGAQATAAEAEGQPRTRSGRRRRGSAAEPTAPPERGPGRRTPPRGFRTSETAGSGHQLKTPL